MPPPLPPRPVCLYCGCDQLGSPDEEVGLCSYIICGACCSLHILDADYELSETGPIVGSPFLRKLSRVERYEASQDPGVKAFLDAYQVAQMELRIGAGAEKRKPKRPGQRVRDGDVLRLELRGPDAR